MRCEDWSIGCCGEQDWIALGDHQGVFVMRRGAAVCRTHSPAVLPQNNASGTSSDNRLDRDYQARRQNLLGGGIGEIGHRRVFVNGAADAMAAQFANDGEMMRKHFALHSAADLPNASAGARDARSFRKGALRTSNQA